MTLVLFTLMVLLFTPMFFVYTDGFLYTDGFVCTNGFVYTNVLRSSLNKDLGTALTSRLSMCRPVVVYSA